MPTRARRSARLSITLSEDEGVRYLHFGTVWIQGGMRIARPFALELDYQRQMMAVALLIPAPRRIVQLGLGAGALTKFCHRFVAGAHTVAVDISQSVIDTARAWFCLPEDDERLTVVTDDAKAFLADRRRCGRADWLQVDLYDAKARGPVYDDADFYRLCRRALAKPGVAAFNLFRGSFDASFAAIAEAFDDRVLVLPEVDDGNHIVLACAGPRWALPLAELKTRAVAIEKAWKLPARGWAAALTAQQEQSDALRV